MSRLFRRALPAAGGDGRDIRSHVGHSGAALTTESWGWSCGAAAFELGAAKLTTAELMRIQPFTANRSEIVPSRRVDRSEARLLAVAIWRRHLGSHSDVG